MNCFIYFDHARQYPLNWDCMMQCQHLIYWPFHFLSLIATTSMLNHANNKSLNTMILDSHINANISAISSANTSLSHGLVLLDWTVMSATIWLLLGGIGKRGRHVNRGVYRCLCFWSLHSFCLYNNYSKKCDWARDYEWWFTVQGNSMELTLHVADILNH